MSRLHPTRRRLQRWIADPQRGRVERHLSGCERCSDKLNGPEIEAFIKDLLAGLVEPPTPVEDTMRQVRRRERATRWTVTGVLQKLASWVETGHMAPDPEPGDEG